MVRFWSKVHKTRTCWLWKGAVGSHGYGDFYTGDKRVHTPAHRFSWELHFGTIPKHMFVCHTCDVKLCVHPRHLWLGTTQENTQDKMNKGRYVYPKPTRGEDHPKCKLTKEQVKYIRHVHKCKTCLHKLVANRFNVSASLVQKIYLGKNWNWYES